MIFGSILSSLESLIFKSNFISFTQAVYAHGETKQPIFNKRLAVYLDFQWHRQPFTLTYYNFILGWGGGLFLHFSEISFLSKFCCCCLLFTHSLAHPCNCQLVNLRRDVTTVWLLFYYIYIYQDNPSINPVGRATALSGENWAGSLRFSGLSPVCRANIAKWAGIWSWYLELVSGALDTLGCLPKVSLGNQSLEFDVHVYCSAKDNEWATANSQDSQVNIEINSMG